MSFDNLLLERDGAVAVLSVNHPRVLNALNTPTINELRDAVLELKHDATARAVILTGAGGFIASTDDMREGTTAFLEKVQARFTDR